ncbi:hypothetical protein B0O80DRAFT_437265 [Mortierella sp. GBAus27b]|nr:hypothetical protein B0O80DRAFT_437265 [Mortierella sp. GBAus27b]
MSNDAEAHNYFTLPIQRYSMDDAPTMVPATIKRSRKLQEQPCLLAAKSPGLVLLSARILLAVVTTRVLILVILLLLGLLFLLLLGLLLSLLFLLLRLLMLFVQSLAKGLQSVGGTESRLRNGTSGCACLHDCIAGDVHVGEKWIVQVAGRKGPVRSWCVRHSSCQLGTLNRAWEVDVDMASQLQHRVIHFEGHGTVYSTTGLTPSHKHDKLEVAEQSALDNAGG